MKQNEKTLNGLMDIMHSELSSGGNVSLIGLGVFSVTDRKARVAWSLKTREEVEVKTKEIPVFRAGSTLKRAVNNR